MLSLGMDIGTSTVKLVLLKNQEIEKQWMAVHRGTPFVCLKKGLSTLELAMDTPFSLCVTGSNTEALLEQDSAIPSLGDIPAIVEGVRWIIPQVGSVIEIGSQGARFITDLQSCTPQFSGNEHCAGGTGSFFEDQMSRVGCKLEDYSSLVEQAQSVPRLSGRCAVFAKTDIIHRQQEGVSTPDILLGLCYAMIRNYKATIVRRLPVCKPVVFCGGVTCNTGVIRAIREVFGLTEEELIVPEEARFEAAIGAACKAEGAFTLAQLDALLNNAMTAHSTTTGLPRLELLPGTDLQPVTGTRRFPQISRPYTAFSRPQQPSRPNTPVLHAACPTVPDPSPDRDGPVSESSLFPTDNLLWHPWVLYTAPGTQLPQVSLPMPPIRSEA